MKSKKKREDEVPVVSLYYGHMGETVNTRDEGLPSPVLCCECSQTKALMAVALPRKEVKEWTVNRVVDFTHRLGHYRVVVKADQEHATKEFIN